MTAILWIDNPVPNCGVYQYGQATCEHLSQSTRYRFVRVLATEPGHLYQACEQHRPPVVIINSHQGLGWLDYRVMHTAADQQWRDLERTIKFIGVKHDSTPTQHTLSAILDTDPDAQSGVPRPIPLYRSPCQPTANVPVIGTFGFGLGGKAYHKLAAQVGRDFPAGAILRAHLPAAAFGDAQGTGSQHWAALMQAQTPGHVRLDVSYDFLDPTAMIDWLASNHLNAFFYDRNFGRGCASTIDYALAAERPIALTDSWQFRHVIDAKPRIFVEAPRSLAEILAAGIAPLQAFHRRWNTTTICAAYEALVDYWENA